MTGFRTLLAVIVYSRCSVYSVGVPKSIPFPISRPLGKLGKIVYEVGEIGPNSIGLFGESGTF